MWSICPDDLDRDLSDLSVWRVVLFIGPRVQFFSKPFLWVKCGAVLFVLLAWHTFQTCVLSTACVFFYVVFFAFPFIVFALLGLLLPPSRNSDPGSRGGLFSPLLSTVHALHFYRKKGQNTFSALVDSRLILGYPVNLPGYTYNVYPTNGYVSPMSPVINTTPVSMLRSMIFSIVYPGRRVAMVLTPVPYPKPPTLLSTPMAHSIAVSYTHLTLPTNR